MSDKTLVVRHFKNRAGYVTPVHEDDYKAFEHCNHNDNNRHYATFYDFEHHVWPLMRMHGYTNHCFESDIYSAIKKLSDADCNEILDFARKRSDAILRGDDDE